MDGFTFFSKFIATLAWPATAIGLAILYRGPVGKLIDRIVSIKGVGLEASFREGLDELQDSVSSGGNFLPASLSAQQMSGLLDVGIPPSYLIQRRFSELEIAIREQGVAQQAADPTSPVSLSSVVDRMTMPDDLRNDLSKLRLLRNQAAHDLTDSLSVTDALRFQELADAVERRLRALA